ncbi:Energy-coupling factor transporter ATP-binding protein EcfA2 [compost metagenome]
MDEPTAGLDPVSRTAMLQLLKNWQQQENRTLIFVSHQMEDVAEYSDEVMVFHEGYLRGHFETSSLFLEQAQLLEDIGLSLPQHVQLLKLIEELTGSRIEVASCREEDIFTKIMPIWNTRRL